MDIRKMNLAALRLGGASDRLTDTRHWLDLAASVVDKEYRDDILKLRDSIEDLDMDLERVAIAIDAAIEASTK